MSRIAPASMAALALFCFAGSPELGARVQGKAGVLAQNVQHHHPLHHALWELRLAHKELKESPEDFNGEKEKALHSIHKAITQIEIMLKSLGANESGTPTKRDLSAEYKKYTHHPHLHHALVELRRAHTHLKETKHDFGGHREAGLRDIHHAIHHLEVLLKVEKKLKN